MMTKGAKRSTKRPSRNQYEARLIQLLRWRFEKSNLRVFDHLKVGKLPLEIDVVVILPKRKWIPDFDKFPRLFDYFRGHNIIEVKTKHNRLKIEDIPKLLAYGWLYMARNRITDVSVVTATALVHHLTPAVEKVLLQFGFAPKAKGIYWRDFGMVAYVISFADLPDELLPEELRAFSDPEKRQHTFLSCLGDYEKSPIVETIFDLYEREVKRIMLNIREESLKNILSAVGEKRIVSALGDKRIVSALGEKRIVSALGEKRIVSALGDKRIVSALGDERVISALGDEKIIAALLRNERLLTSLLAKLDAKQLRKILEEKSRTRAKRRATKSGSKMKSRH